MERKRLFRQRALAIFLLVSLHFGWQQNLAAQEMHHGVHAIRSNNLTIRSYDGKTLTLSSDDLAKLPHKSVTVFNSHTKTNENYSGVPLPDLLAKVQVPQGQKVREALLLTGLIAEGTDGYKVLYSLAEVDPEIHRGEVIVADTIDGKKLGDDGAFRLVSTEDKRPARWVRNLTAITVVSVKP